MQFAVGFKIQGKTGHVVDDAEDALIAARKVKMQRPEALIAMRRLRFEQGRLFLEGIELAPASSRRT